MRGYRSFGYVTAAGIIAATVSAPIPRAGHVDLTLLSAEGPLSGSDYAIILGGTTEPTPSPEFARAAESLYLHPLGFDGGTDPTLVCDMTGTDPCSAALQVLTTPELIQQGPSGLTAASDVVLAVQKEFAVHPGEFSAEHPLTVFGYSQSAGAESIAMEQLHADGIPLQDVHFVFIGDPSLPGGVYNYLEEAMDQTLGTKLTDFMLNLFHVNGVLDFDTPTDLYPTTVYSLDTDPVPNFEEIFEQKGLWGALLNILGPHVEYLGLTPDEIANATTTDVGNLTEVDISDSDVSNLDAWLSAVFLHGAANSGLLTSVIDSMELLFTNTF